MFSDLVAPTAGGVLIGAHTRHFFETANTGTRAGFSRWPISEFDPHDLQRDGCVTDSFVNNAG